MDWKTLEAEIIEVTVAAIDKWASKNKRHHAYAFAFHESYRELDAQIAFPFLGVNSLEVLGRGQEVSEPELEWNPAEWRWENILPVRRMHQWEASICEEANRSTQAQWYRTEKKFISMLVRVCKALRTHFAKHANTAKDLVVYFDDEDGGLELVKKCLTAALFEKHFSKFEDDDFSNLSDEQRLQMYWNEPWMHEKAIVALGEAAVEPLLAMLEESEHGWCAPSLLDDLGIRNNKVLDALRTQVKTSSKGGPADASAYVLGYWGDLEFLFQMVKRDASRTSAVRGIVARLKANASNRKDPVPLDYGPVEELLNLRSAAITKLVNSELEPGSSFIEIKPSDVDEALRGLESNFTTIRQHAVCVLGDRSLGKAAANKIFPELAKRLYDEVPNVRRLTLLAFSYWKAAAKPYHEEMQKLQKSDPDSDVRFWARYVFDR